MADGRSLRILREHQRVTVEMRSSDRYGCGPLEDGLPSSAMVFLPPMGAIIKAAPYGCGFFTCARHDALAEEVKVRRYRTEGQRQQGKGIPRDGCLEEA
jgi:hypothetical protein